MLFLPLELNLDNRHCFKFNFFSQKTSNWPKHSAFVKYPMSTNNLFKTTVLEYLEGLPQNVQSRLYESPASCLAIYRILPQLAKFLIMSMVFNEQEVALTDLSAWVTHQGKYEFNEAIKTMSSLHVIIKAEDPNDRADTKISLNHVFRISFRNALTGGEVHKSFGVVIEDDTDDIVLDPKADQSTLEKLRKLKQAKKRKNRAKSTQFLDQYAADKWETILHYMVGTPGMKAPSETVLNLLIHGNLMKEEQNGDLKITNEGFQFLLQEVNVQIWALLLQYLKLAESLQMNPVDVLNFIFMLGSLELGQRYSIDSLSKVQLSLLKDMSNYGLIYHDEQAKEFYSTRMATILTSDLMSIRSASNAMNSVIAHKDSDESAAAKQLMNQEDELDPSNIMDGALIIETNFKLYSYSNSPLQIAILSLFVHLKARFSNMVTGQITRESIRRALKNGITAEQIIAYLESHAHPQMIRMAEEQLTKKTELDPNTTETLQILPPTVVDQIKLWQLELDRIIHYDGYLYSDFDTLKEYHELANYADDIGVLIWKNDKKKMFFVDYEGNSQVVEYAKRLVKREDQDAD